MRGLAPGDSLFCRRKRKGHVMKRITVALTLMISGANAAFAGGGTAVVPEMDGGFALVAAAVVMGIGAVVYEKFFRK